MLRLNYLENWLQVAPEPMEAEEGAMLWAPFTYFFPKAIATGPHWAQADRL